MTPAEVARALGGKVTGRNIVRAPGPGHSRDDDSLVVWVDPDAPDGFRCHPHSPKDDWKTCHDHVRQRLGLPKWEPQRKSVDHLARMREGQRRLHGRSDTGIPVSESRPLRGAKTAQRVQRRRPIA